MSRMGYEYMLKILNEKGGFSVEKAQELTRRIDKEKQNFLDQHECQRLLDHIRSKRFKDNAKRNGTKRVDWKRAIIFLDVARRWYIDNLIKPITPPPPSVLQRVQRFKGSPPLSFPKKGKLVSMASSVRKEIGIKADIAAKQAVLAKTREKAIVREVVIKMLGVDSKSKRPLFALLRPGVFQEQYKRRSGTFKGFTNRPDLIRDGQVRQIESALVNFNGDASLENIFKLSRIVEGIEKNIKDKSSILKQMCTEMKTALDQVRSSIREKLFATEHKVIKPKY